ncbi:MAG: class I SAM-dependent methyltransferase [Candidatus Shapirobacteria bacterium]|jgi:ubiquinone/menaquinone biosynthesis C-methylase UbiE|nr:class I SAM-dependent methyltransferase [Candidatus Shapirobacteria bacterium]
MINTSWEKSSNWYKKIVGDDGHYFHQTIIFPKIKRLIDFSKINSVLDLACGQGIFERQLDQNKEYVGIDISRSLINEASKKSINKRHQFLVSDASKDLPLKKDDFDLVTIILALQNIKNINGVIKNASKHLKKDGKFLIILNHPIFRIPRQSAWGVDSQNKIQYRRIERYMSNLEIPISTNPGKFQKSEITWSFHNPLSKYSQLLFENGFLIEKIDEWVSEKKSTGPMAKMEDRARKEIPMFMAIVASQSFS